MSRVATEQVDVTPKATESTRGGFCYALKATVDIVPDVVPLLLSCNAVVDGPPCPPPLFFKSKPRLTLK